ncbi:MAG: DUF1622 domain-containing protein [Phycisphaerales bacterium]|nr:MAG: DUF1622 domain-containing protein [Phycisphaerales bacterium]
MIALHYLSVGIGIAGVAVIVWGAARTLVRAVCMEFRQCWKNPECCARVRLRQEFGSYLLLALEFLIAADIVNTIAHPTLSEMAVLGSIVAIRTVISFFLHWELQRAPDRKPEDEAKETSREGD